MLAEERGAQVANLYEINELIIRRMRTGVLVVDTHNHITLANEAALALLGDGDQRNAPADLSLAALTPELARRLQRWRSGWRQEEAPCSWAPTARKCSRASCACSPTATWY